VTASCTACHSESLFGKPIIGLTNKTPRANKAFDLAAKLVPKVHPRLIKLFAGATQGDMDLWKEAQKTMQWIGVKEPQVLGLDTSLAVVSISLAKRADDEYASITPEAYKNPRETSLLRMVSDSKPMPWFTLKYKTRWLSDGSVISGNPILTNILWNEIGRGVDLRELEAWVEKEDTKKKIIELTTAVFGTTPPHYTDFFSAESIPLERAKHGQVLFENNCIKCHGRYEKAWDQINAQKLSSTELLKTTIVHYPKQTKVKDVGTDANRYHAMEKLAPDLNKLRISQLMNIKVVPQKGYVPPPLVGIWSRWPYFHNNSAPTLCDVLLKPELRRKKWYVGSPVNKQSDFDSECNGFPALSKAPKEWKKKDRLFDTRKDGLTNSGHYIDDFSAEEIRNLVWFLKTL
jgi:cytochrome c5